MLLTHGTRIAIPGRYCDNRLGAQSPMLQADLADLADGLQVKPFPYARDAVRH